VKKSSEMEGKQNLVVLTGAGISAESGLKTFRDSDGLWMGHNIEDVATPRGFAKDPALVLEFYNMRRQEVKNAQPNAAHTALAALEEKYNVTIVTQNIDDLHERAGSTNVVHLHGEIFKMHSLGNPNKVLHIDGDIKVGDLGSDGTQLRPHIVWFEEPVPMIVKATQIMQTADIFVLVGTSLQVYPAAGLIDYVADAVPKYIVDKKIPTVNHYFNIIPIEKTATEGVTKLLKLLKFK
jgi:NAD-dependent deacetylase